MHIKELVVKNIKFYREQSGLSQEELSMKINRNRNFIGRLENHEFKREPTIKLADDIANVLDIDTKLLFRD